MATDLEQDVVDRGELNPHITHIIDDVRDRTSWYQKDDEIRRRRLAERKVKTRPYRGAPNMVVPIIDGEVTSKTDQELTLINNAPRYAHAVPLDKVTPEEKQKVELLFDTFLRHVVIAPPKFEECIDQKNEGGFGNFKVFVKEHPKFGTIPFFDTFDRRDFVYRTDAKEIQDEERGTHILRWTRRQLARKRGTTGWKTDNIETLLERHKGGFAPKEGVDSEKSPQESTEKLIGITTGGKNAKRILIYEHHRYASDYDVEQDITGRVKKNHKCMIYFCPDAPELILAVKPWYKEVQRQLSPEEAAAEAQKELIEGETSPIEFTDEGIPFVTDIVDRPWPVIQSRYSNRDRHYYASRGIGHLVLDHQVSATAIRNAMLTRFDYTASPLIKRDVGAADASGNVSFEPGTPFPVGWSWQDPPRSDSSLELALDYELRDAAKRSGTAGFQNTSEQVSARRSVEKTATEVQSTDARVAMISSASVDRAMDPYRELFEQLRELLVELRPKLPMMFVNDFKGFSDDGIYDVMAKVMFVPAASSKTLDPISQFNITKGAVDWVAAYAEKFGVGADIQGGVTHAIGYLSPELAKILLVDPNDHGPNGQPPVYKILEQMAKALQVLGQNQQNLDEQMEAVLGLSAETADKTAELEGQVNATDEVAVAGANLAVETSEQVEQKGEESGQAQS